MIRSRGFLSRLRASLSGGRGETRRFDYRSIRGEEGATLVEMTLACTILLSVLFGIFEVSMALYTLNFVSDAAREGTRYAMVRGSACTGLPDCKATASQVQTYVRSLPYPAIVPSKLTVTTTWWSASTTQPTTWSSCTSGTCNAPGNAVRVQVVYAFPLSIPFWKATTLNVGSTSQKVISQ